MAKKRVPKSGRKSGASKGAEEAEGGAPDIIKFSLDQTFTLDAVEDDDNEDLAELLRAEHEPLAKPTAERKGGAGGGGKGKPGRSENRDARTPRGAGRSARGSSEGDRVGSPSKKRGRRAAKSDAPSPEADSQSGEIQASADQVLGRDREAASEKKKPKRKKTINLLTGLTRAQVKDLRGFGVQTTYEAGDPVYTKGEPSHGTYIILRGAVDVTLDLWGGQCVEYKTQVGEFFGEEEPGAGIDVRAWNAVARRHTEIFEIPGDAFETFRWITDGRASMRLLRNSVCILARRLRKRSTRQKSSSGRASRPHAHPEHGLVQILETLLEPSLVTDVEHNPYLKHLEIAEGGYLYRRGDAPNGFFIVLEGELEVIGKSRTGKAKKSAVLTSPTVVGEVSNFSKQKRSLSIRALTPVTVMQFRDDIFTEIRRLEPETALDLLYLTARFLGGLAAMPKPMLEHQE